MVLGIGDRLGDVLHIHLLKDTPLIGFHGIDRLADIVGDIVHGIALSGERKHLTLIVGQRDFRALHPLVVIK